MAGGTPDPERRRWIALTALAVAVGLTLRLAAAISAPVWEDEARRGLMARHVLAGLFPHFSYGQTFNGAVDAYLHAVTFAAVGSSPGAMRAWPLVVAGLHVLLTGILAQRILGRCAWALCFALLPSAPLLKWAQDARLTYDLILVLTPTLLLLALRAVDGTTAAIRTRALLVGGMIAGFGWWVTLLMTAPIAAAALFVVVRRPRLRLSALALPLAGLLGSAPFWVFAAWRGRPGTASVAAASPAGLSEYGWSLLTNALPILMGAPYAPPGRVARLLFAAWACGLLALAVAAWLRDVGVRRDGRLLLASLFGITLLMVVATERGRVLTTEDPRYLLPLLAVLPVILAASVASAARVSRAAAGGLVLAVLGLHGVGLWFEYPALFSRDAWRARLARGAGFTRQVDQLEARGLTAVYTHDPDVLAFVSGERVAVSHFYQEAYPPLARRVDGAAEVAYLSRGVPPGFDESLAAAGIRFARESSVVGWLYSGFFRTQGGFREVPPAGWTATALPGATQAAHAIDRDAGTSWATGRPRRSGMWFQIDLGQARDVGMVTWLPAGFQEVPLGFRLETSDGTGWTVAHEVPTYYGPLYWSGTHPMGRVRWGRVEVQFPPRPTRFVRLTHIGEDHRFAWSIRELFVYEATEARSDHESEGAVAAGALRRAGVRRVYADHAVGARLAESSGAQLTVLPANLQVDVFGAMPAPNHVPVFEAGPDVAIVLPPSLPSAPWVEETLRSAGWRFRRETEGGYTLLTQFVRLAPSAPLLAVRGATVFGGPGPTDGSASIDGRLETRWSTARPQKAGDWLRVDLPEATVLTGVELDLGRFRTDYPRGLRVEVADASGVFTPVPARSLFVGPLRWMGTHLLRDGMDRVVVSFPPVRTRSLRLVQTGADPVFDWSVSELRLLGS
jgi:hypothetical protein